MFTVKLKTLMEEFHLEPVCMTESAGDIDITTSDVNRPGLQLSGYMEYFGSDRIQIIGKVEMTYLASLSPQERQKRLDEYFRTGFPCLVIARDQEPFGEMVQASQKYSIPILKTRDITSRFMSGLIRYLNVMLAPRISQHGVLVEVYGEGILILGESGVGKSETALELVKRGHRLIADDLVEIRRVSDTTLLGSAPENIRHFIEIRGIGIVDVKNLFGMGAVKMQENINLVIKLELWKEGKMYDRLGLEDQFTDILGISVPSLVIPVRPGRNLAIIVEVAAMNHRQKKMGYNAAKLLSERFLKYDD
ncbi:MAG: HPr(Ser) kinase/phosphatase [Acetivibrionales bacterium]|jgi:HPr kinase/phosphorylase|nr:HPr(Ser) kinase/phosphatase [Bacillota bacterium]NLP07157.1 HPr kinase/phosphorylase [Clostridiaceae bacterium]HOA55991.1 HPr(Ser) kinase/phosphatase [Clostridiales bacterium]HQD30438.1 HPr(Ser) kinase/phosphatase [Clostridiales bacterium]